MSIIPYNSVTLGGSFAVEVAARFQRLAAEATELRDMVDQHGVTTLRTSGLFGVPDGPTETPNQHAQAFNDTIIGVCDSYRTWYGDGSADTNREKIARWARGD